MNNKHAFTYGAVAGICMAMAGSLTLASAADMPAAAQPLDAAKAALLDTCATEKYALTPKLRRAFLAYAKQQAAADFFFAFESVRFSHLVFLLLKRFEKIIFESELKLNQ